MISSWDSVNHWNFNDDMKEKIHSANSISRSTSESILADNIETIKRAISLDEVDNNPKLEHSVSVTEKEKKLFETMKYELNRLNSFNGKWPLSYVKPADLAEAGLFYLQSEDNVQCAFCKEVINDWNVGDKPSKVHMKKSPKCPFLLTLNVGNIPVTKVPSTNVSQKSTQNVTVLPSDSSSYRPKHPRMADVNKRIMTYKDWPCIMLNPKQLADCGLYYTGVADVVTCFFCGGSLGNWELNDDPWDEHVKFFPNCAYMSLARRHGKKQQQTQFSKMVVPSFHNPAITTYHLHSVESDFMQQAREIFPSHLVETILTKQLKEHGRPFSSLNELCEAALDYKQKLQPTRSQDIDEVAEKRPEAVASSSAKVASSSAKVLNPTANRTDVKDIFLCKICMDREMGVVFQPCGHLVSCPKCAELIFDCPLCRSPVIGKVRTYLS